MITESDIQAVILTSIENINRTRPSHLQLDVSPEAGIFGGDSPLDSLGLVSLIIDIEEALEAQGVSVSLSDARAMSQTRSPFRSVRSLTEYVLGAMNVRV